VTTTVDRIASPGEKTVGFERVEQRNHDARIGLHLLTELLLAHRPAVVEEAKQLELAWRELVPGMRLAQPPHRVLPKQREQKAGARAVLLQQAGYGLRSLPVGVTNRHVHEYIGQTIIEVGISSNTIKERNKPPDADAHRHYDKRHKEKSGMKIGRLLLRLTVGSLFIGHGTQKLFGWFGGRGLDATANMFEHTGLRPGRRNAIAAGAAEAGGGTALALGLATPLAASVLSATMLTAIHRVHLKNGPWVTNGGYEYNLVLIAAVLALAEVGPGELSLDAALGQERSGPGWALAALALGAVGALGAYGAAQAEPSPPPPAETQARPTEKAPTQTEEAVTGQ
jgi:putative oxidoreductase